MKSIETKNLSGEDLESYLKYKKYKNKYYNLVKRSQQRRGGAGGSTAGDATDDECSSSGTQPADAGNKGEDQKVAEIKGQLENLKNYVAAGVAEITQYKNNIVDANTSKLKSQGDDFNVLFSEFIVRLEKIKTDIEENLKKGPEEIIKINTNDHEKEIDIIASEITSAEEKIKAILDPPASSTGSPSTGAPKLLTVNPNTLTLKDNTFSCRIILSDDGTAAGSIEYLGFDENDKNVDSGGNKKNNGRIKVVTDHNEAIKFKVTVSGGQVTRIETESEFLRGVETVNFELCSIDKDLLHLTKTRKSHNKKRDTPTPGGEYRLCINKGEKKHIILDLSDISSDDLKNKLDGKIKYNSHEFSSCSTITNKYYSTKIKYYFGDICKKIGRYKIFEEFFEEDKTLKPSS